MPEADSRFDPQTQGASVRTNRRRPIPPDPAAVEVLRQLRTRNLFLVQASGIRTAIAATTPFFIGQAVGQPIIGLMVGLGALYVTIADKDGATGRTLLVTAAGVAVTAAAGALAGSAPIWLAVPLMFAVAFLLGLLGRYGETAANVGFILTLVYAVTQGLPTTLRGGLERFVEYGLGGVWTILLTLGLWAIQQRLGKRPAPSAGAATPGACISHACVRDHSLRLAIASAIGLALYRCLHLEHGYWILLTVLVIVKPEYTATRQRAFERMLGSVLGGAVGLLLAVFLRNIVVLDLLLVVFAVLAYSHSPRSYSLFTLFLTPFVVLMLNIVEPGDWQIALVRIGNTLAGGVLALIIATLLRPEAVVAGPASPA